MNSKHKKHEENYTKAYYNEIVKIRAEEKKFKSSQKRQNTSYTAEQMTMTVDFLIRNNVRLESDIFKVQGKKKNPRILYPVKLSFKNKGEILFQTYTS